ncbi:MAG: peptidoglycan DD-metalloendopeptidase family protein [bacterium]|nr:peptidoglycan DD-metalloendopeptidase family protein [bacterium]
MFVNHVLKSQDEIITSNYGNRTYTINNRQVSDFHNGIDLVSKSVANDEIIAYSDGIVSAVNNSVSGFSQTKGAGNYVYINHNNNYQTRYLHIKKDTIKVKVGDKVKKGQVLGTIGLTGWATGVHLHFGVYLNNTMQNPLDYLTGKKAIESTSQNIIYTVVKGDTLTKIAKQYNTTVEKLVKLNNIQDRNLIKINQKIIIPTANSYLKTTYQGTSIVDALKSINVDSSYKYRSQLASINNISNYTGTAEQNTKMLNMLKQGILKISP